METLKELLVYRKQLQRPEEKQPKKNKTTYIQSRDTTAADKAAIFKPLDIGLRVWLFHYIVSDGKEGGKCHGNGSILGLCRDIPERMDNQMEKNIKKKKHKHGKGP